MTVPTPTTPKDRRREDNKQAVGEGFVAGVTCHVGAFRVKWQMEMPRGAPAYTERPGKTSPKGRLRSGSQE